MLFKKGDVFLKDTWVNTIILFWAERQWYVLKKNGDVEMKVEGAIKFESPKFRVID